MLPTTSVTTAMPTVHFSELLHLRLLIYTDFTARDSGSTTLALTAHAEPGPRWHTCFSRQNKPRPRVGDAAPLEGREAAQQCNLRWYTSGTQKAPNQPI